MMDAAQLFRLNFLQQNNLCLMFAKMAPPELMLCPCNDGTPRMTVRAKSTLRSGQKFGPYPVKIHKDQVANSFLKVSAHAFLSPCK